MHLLARGKGPLNGFPLALVTSRLVAELNHGGGRTSVELAAPHTALHRANLGHGCLIWSRQVPELRRNQTLPACSEAGGQQGQVTTRWHCYSDRTCHFQKCLHNFSCSDSFKIIGKVEVTMDFRQSYFIAIKLYFI